MDSSPDHGRERGTGAELDIRRADARPVVLITGSNGFLGQAIARGLADRYRVIGLDLHPPRQPLPGVESIAIDLTSDASVAAGLGQVGERSGGAIACVIHLAAYYDISGKDNPNYQTVTVDGTRRLLAGLQAFDVTQFVFASTLLVHAPSPARGVRIDEDSPLDPAWAYPRSKVETEALIRRLHGAMKVVILRLAGVYDEDCHAAFVAQQIARIFERMPTAYLFAGDIDTGQPYLHKDDLVDAVVRVVDRRDQLPPDATLLIGEPDTPSYDAMQKRIGALVHGETWRTLSLPKEITKMGAWVQQEVLDEDSEIKPWMVENADDHYEIDIARAHALLGWQPRHRLIDTLPEMVRRLRADPTDWYRLNKLEPAKVAASAPELAQAADRLQQPLERPRAAVIAETAARHAATLWAPMLAAALGLWLIASPFLLGLFDPATATVPPALGHAEPLASVRNSQLGVSDMVSGALICGLSLLGMRRRWQAVQWLTAAVGLWVMFAPLQFWTTSAGAYGGDTLVGMLVIVLAVMVPPTPGVSDRALAADDDRPLGWSYSPSTFSQRIHIVALAFIGLLVSRYLAAYQLGHIESLWDPFFGSGSAPVTNGSEAVVTSWVSRGFPIADAGLGAFAYGLDILAGAIGDRRRWRTMPWMVVLFGLLIVPLGLVSVGFIIIQPPLIGTLCALCLFQALLTVLLIPYSLDEVLASCQYLWRARQAGEPFWRTFWRGGPALSDDQTPAPDLDRPLGAVLREVVSGGVNFPWTLVVTVLLGVLLMLTPVLFGTRAPLYFSDHISGCLIILVAITAMAEVARALRFLNILLGGWIIVSPVALSGASAVGTIADVLIGVAVIGLSLPRGTRSSAHYGGWDRAIV